MKTLRKILVVSLLLILAVMTLTACGEPEGKAKYTVNFDVNGENAVFQTTVNVSEKGNVVNAGWRMSEPAAPTREGYSFAGWYKDKACSDNQRFEFNQGINEDCTLYAKWIPITKYKFNFYDKTDANNPILLFSFEKYINESVKKTDILKIEDYKDKNPDPNTIFTGNFYDDVTGKLMNFMTSTKVQNLIQSNDGTEINYYTKRLNITNKVSFKTDNNINIIVDSFKGKLDFNKAVRYNGDTATDDDFVIIDGVRVMVKAKINEGEIFDYWQISSSNTFEYYNDNGNKLAVDANGKLLIADGAYVEEKTADGKTISILDKDFSNIISVSAMRKPQYYTITFVKYEGTNEIVIGTKSVLHGTRINPNFTDAQIGVPENYEIKGWTYAEDYPSMGVLAGSDISLGKGVNCDVKVSVVFQKSERKVVFTVADYQHFNGTALSYSYILTENESGQLYFDYLSEDFQRVVGGTYYGVEGITIPSNTDKDAARLEYEKLLFKQQYKLLGFVDINGAYMFKVINGILQPVDSSGNGIDYVDLGSRHSVTLKPKFEIIKHTVTMKLGAGETVPNNQINIQTTYKNGTTFKAASKEGYEFVKWTLEDGTLFDGKFPVFEDLTVIPVFKILNYEALFYNDNNENLFTDVRFIATINTPIDAAHMQMIFDKQAEISANVPLDQQKYYVFDKWYATNSKGIKITLDSLRRADGNYYLTENLTFKPGFIYKKYSIQYMQFDYYASLDKLSYKNLQLVENCFDKNGILPNYSIVEYTNSPIPKEFLNGWFYYDLQGNAVAFDRTTKVSEDIVDVANKGNVLTVYPYLATFNVDLNANGGVFIITKTNGTQQETSTLSVQGGYFGFELGKNVKLVKKYNNFNNYYQLKPNQNWKKLDNTFIADNKVQINQNLTLSANWTPVNFNVTLHYNNVINGVDTELTEIFDGNVEGIQDPDNKITLFNLFGINESDGDYDLKLYIIKNSLGEIQYIDKSYAVTGDTDVYAIKKYIKKAILFDANGIGNDAYFVGENTYGENVLETFVTEIGLEMFDPNGGLYTKKEVDEPVDQGMPVRVNYVFNGWATVPKADWSKDTIFYVYKDAHDLHHSGITEKKMWLGDFKKYDSELYDRSTGQLKVTKLYAQWIVVKSRVNYYYRGDTTKPVTNFPNFDKYFLYPNEFIANPYTHGKVTWSMTEGGQDIIDRGIKASDYNNITAKDLEQIYIDRATGELFYLTNVPVYESLAIGTPINISVSYHFDNNNIRINKYDSTGKFNNYFSDSQLEFETDISGNMTGNVLRHTFSIEKSTVNFIDNALGNAFSPYAYASDRHGKYDEATGDYVIDLEVYEAFEKVPVKISADFMLDYNAVKTSLFGFGDRLVYPYANIKGRLLYDNYNRRYYSERLGWVGNDGTTFLDADFENPASYKVVSDYVTFNIDRVIPKLIDNRVVYIYKTELTGKWTRMPNSIDTLTINYKYKKENEQIYTIYTTRNIGLKNVVNDPNQDFVQNPTLNEKKQITTDQGQKIWIRRTWTINDRPIDRYIYDFDAKTGKYQNQITCMSLLKKADLIITRNAQGNYVYTVVFDAIEKWVEDTPGVD